MKIHRWKDIRHAGASEREVDLTRVKREVVEEVLLEQLGDLVGLTQAEMTARIEAWRAQRPAGERRDDPLRATLREFVEALGGKLRLQAVFEDGRVLEIEV